MLGKVTNSLSYLGVAGILAALFYYSVYRQWDWKTQVALYGGAGFILVFLALNLSNIRAGLRTRAVRYGSACRSCCFAGSGNPDPGQLSELSTSPTSGPDGESALFTLGSESKSCRGTGNSGRSDWVLSQ